MAENKKNENVEEVKEEEKETKPKTTKKKTTKKPKKKSIAQIRKLMKDSEAVIVNNDGATLIYIDKITGQEIRLPEYGDSLIVEVELLRRMKSAIKSFFEDYKILITDVICEDESITLEDVYEYVGISKYYKDIENPDSEFFDNLLQEVDSNTFEEVMNKMNKGMLLQLSHRAIALFKEEEFNDYSKISLIEGKLGLEDLFKDIRNAR